MLCILGSKRVHSAPSVASGDRQPVEGGPHSQSETSVDCVFTAFQNPYLLQRPGGANHREATPCS